MGWEAHSKNCGPRGDPCLLFALAHVALGAGGNPDRTDGIPQLVGSEAGADQALAVEPVAARRTPTQGYAHVTLGTATSPPTFDPARSKAVKRVTAVQTSPGQYTPSRVCLDLAFIPNVAVGSPFINNGAIVATATPPDNFNQSCPEGYRDAAVRTYGNDENEAAVSFKIMFR